jgi:hypothetical protein
VKWLHLSSYTLGYLVGMAFYTFFFCSCAVLLPVTILSYYLARDKGEKRLYEAKIDFFYKRACHEIRTPLKLIKGPV